MRQLLKGQSLANSGPALKTDVECIGFIAAIPIRVGRLQVNLHSVQVDNATGWWPTAHSFKLRGHRMVCALLS
jgi:hypothetical protein